MSTNRARQIGPTMSSHQPPGMSPELFRELGHRAIDAIATRFEEMHNLPLSVETDRAVLESLLHEPLPELPSDAQQVMECAIDDVLKHAVPIDHPRFFAFVPSPITPVSVLADLLTAGWNPFLGSWLAAPGPAMVELVTLDWLRKACNMPDSTSGIFTTGGSAATLTCLQIARDERVAQNISKAVAYTSDQTHTAVDRSLQTLGIKSSNRRVITSNDDFTLDVRALELAIQQDRDNGLVPWCVIANAGTTNTAAIDPLGDIADLCARENLWFHIDGAYGAAAVFCESGKRALQGMERADSLVLDPHKWLFQSYEIGCALVRDGQAMERTFSVLPNYLKDVAPQDGHTNFRDRGLQLSRSFRALKCWMTLKTFGSNQISSWIEQGIHTAIMAQEALEKLPGWNIITPAQLGVMTFQYAPPGLDDQQRDEANDAIAAHMLRSGTAFVTSTRLRDRTVQRICTINPSTTKSDIDSLLDAFVRAAQIVHPTG
jgi:aromatic-L-amino-acid/L-tryptophan decarboxylase